MKEVHLKLMHFISGKFYPQKYIKGINTDVQICVYACSCIWGLYVDDLSDPLGNKMGWKKDEWKGADMWSIYMMSQIQLILEKHGFELQGG